MTTMEKIIITMKELIASYEENKLFFGSSKDIDEYNEDTIRNICYKYHKDTDLYLKFFQLLQ